MYWLTTVNKTWHTTLLFSILHTLSFLSGEPFAQFLIYLSEHCIHLKACPFGCLEGLLRNRIWLRRMNADLQFIFSSSLLHHPLGFSLFWLLPQFIYQEVPTVNCSFMRSSTWMHPKYLVTKTQEGNRLLQFSLQLQVLLYVEGAYLELPSADHVYRSLWWYCGCSLAKAV